MKVLRVIPVPYTCSGGKNISDTKDSRLTPYRIRNLYETNRRIGVSFLKESGFDVELKFLNPNKVTVDTRDLQCHFFMSGLSDGRKDINSRICFLGGDNSISYYSAKGFGSIYTNNKCGLIMLDAHPDLCKKGMPGKPCHSDWLRYLIDEKIYAPENVLCIGWRDIEAEERDFVTKLKLRSRPAILLMEMLRSDWRILSTIMQIQERLVSFCKKFDAIYLSIDMDVVDPAFAPGVNTVSPGGLTSGEFIEIIKALSKIKKIKVFDITEINPDRDINQMTQILAIKTMIEMA